MCTWLYRYSLGLFIIQYDKHIITQTFKSKYNRVRDVMEEKILEELERKRSCTDQLFTV